MTPLREHLKTLEELVEPFETEIIDLQRELEPYNAILDRLKEAKRQFKVLQKKFIKRLHEAREALSENECRDLVLDILYEKLAAHLDSYVTAHRQAVIAAVENWWDKYRVTLRDIEKSREYVGTLLNNFFEEMNYAK